TSLEVKTDETTVTRRDDSSAPITSTDASFAKNLHETSQTAKRVSRNEVLPREIVSTAISPYGSLVALSSVDGQLTLVDFESLKVVRESKTIGAAAAFLAFSPDASIV